MKFRLLHSTHTAKGKTYQKGDIVSSPVDLTKVFPLKFELIPGTDNEDEPKNGASDAHEAPANPGHGEGTAFGEDVTEDFPVAEDAELKVYQKGKSFFVVDPTTPDEALNAKGLKGPEVTKFIKAHLKL